MFSTNYYLCNECNCTSRTSSTCRSSNTMYIIFTMCWNIEIYNNIHMWNIQTSVNKFKQLETIKSNDELLEKCGRFLRGSDE